MGVRSTVHTQRVEAYIEAMQVMPMTLRELEQRTNVAYHTVRNDINKLIEQGIVSPTEQSRNGSIVYKLGRSRPMPMIYHKASDRNFSIVEIAASYANNPFETTSSRAALDVPAVAAEIVYLLGLHADTSHPSHTPISTQNTTLKELRNRLTKDVMFLETILSMANQMIKDERLWNPSHLELVTEDSLFDVRTAIASHETVLELKNASKK